MPCKLCARWRARLARKSDAWERAHSNESELWSQEPLRNRELIDRAYAAYEADPAESFRLYLEAAEAGSSWAMEEVALQYETGIVAPADFAKAEEYYRRAIGAGSWMATLHYARFLAERGRDDECEGVLQGGVAADFVPACHWLAWFRYYRCPSRGLAREIRPLLDHAAGAGHPRAQVFLAHLQTRGKFGLREIPSGLGSAVRMAIRAARSEEEDCDDREAAIRAYGSVCQAGHPPDRL